MWGNTVPPVRNATLQNKVGNIPKPIKTKHSLFFETSNEYLISTTPYENKNDEKIVAIVETMAIISKRGFKLNSDYF